jgi:hypothetical protein
MKSQEIILYLSADATPDQCSNTYSDNNKGGEVGNDDPDQWPVGVYVFHISTRNL